MTLLSSAAACYQLRLGAGQASLGFCLLSFTFISLFISGWGRTQQWIPSLQQYPTVSGKLVSIKFVGTFFFHFAGLRYHFSFRSWHTILCKQVFGSPLLLQVFFGRHRTVLWFKQLLQKHLVTSFSFEISTSFVAVGSDNLDTRSLFRKFGLRAFLVGSFKVIPKVKSVFVFKSSFRWTAWRFAFFGCNSHFIPGINVSAVFVAVFGGQGGGILLQKFFGLDTVKVFCAGSFYKCKLNKKCLCKQQIFSSKVF